MNNEIKEIIEYFKDDIDFLEEELKYPNFKGRYVTIRDKECKYLRKLLDYITNLQEENKNLKNEQISKYQTLKELQEENERLEKGLEYAKRIEKDYKTKFDKAIEYLGINEEILETCEIYDVNGIEVYKILQGNKWNEVERAYLDDKPIGSDKE